MHLGVYGYVFVSLTSSLYSYLVIKDFTRYLLTFSNKISFFIFDKFGMLKMSELV